MIRVFGILFAGSLAVIVLLVGVTIRQDRQHRDDLAAAVVERNRSVNQFLREVCERLELRDEIQIGYLKAAAAQYDKSDPAYASVLADAAFALEITQKGCKENLPNVRPPGDG